MRSFLRACLATVLAIVMLAGWLSPAEANTRMTAYAVGTYHKVGDDWRLKVIRTDFNANAEIAAENMFNDPPRVGYQYVIVTVRGEKLTRGEGDLYWDLDFSLFGRATKRLYDEAYQVTPNDLSDQDPVLKGGRVTGSLCFEVKKTDLRKRGMKLRASEFLTPPVGWYRLH